MEFKKPHNSYISIDFPIYRNIFSQFMENKQEYPYLPHSWILRDFPVYFAFWVVSSIVWGYQGNFKPVYFFLRKNFGPIESTKCKTSNFHHFYVCKKLLPLLFSVCLILFCWLMFAYDMFFCKQNLFIKK